MLSATQSVALLRQPRCLLPSKCLFTRHEGLMGAISKFSAHQSKPPLQSRPFISYSRRSSSHPSEGAATSSRKKVTLHKLQQMYKQQERITMLTAHDYNSATHADRAGVDMLLVGDSLGMVALGLPGTEPVTMEHMVEACKAVARGTTASFIVGDMPFGSYQISPEEAVRNAFRLVKEGNVHAVKLEGGKEMAPVAAKIVQSGIVVMGHIGLTPQSQAALGGFRVQGKTAAKAKELLASAEALQAAGCSFLVIEAVPAAVAKMISSALRIPTIGIGCGADCAGQVLVQMDMLGATAGHIPKFCKKYADVGQITQTAIQAYIKDVKGGAFPGEEHTYAMADGEEAKLPKL